jgi:hypothetical protein
MQAPPDLVEYKKTQNPEIAACNKDIDYFMKYPFAKSTTNQYEYMDIACVP